MHRRPVDHPVTSRRTKLENGRRLVRAILHAAITAIVVAVSEGEIVANDDFPRSPSLATGAQWRGRVIFGQIPVESGNSQAEPPVPEDKMRDLPIGSRVAAFDPTRVDESVTILTPGFSAAGRPDLSFDGRRVLFVGKREPTEPLNVWETEVDGHNLRQITRQSADCGEAIYLSTVYTKNTEEPVYQICFRSAQGGGADSLYTCRMDGTQTRQITFTPDGVSDPFLLSDGRLLFSCWRPVQHDFPANPPRAAAQASRRGSALFTVNTDGTDVSVFAAAHEPPAARFAPCETPDGLVIYVESGAFDGGNRLALTAVSRTRSLHTRRMLADDSAGCYQSPSPSPDGNLLVSYRAGSNGSYGLYVLDPTTGRRITKVFDAPRWHDVDALAVRPRLEPAGRSSQVDYQVDHGYLYCLDAYLSSPVLGDEVEPGRIKRLRVIKAVPDDRAGRRGASTKETTDWAVGAAGEEILGEAPVETDGSCYLSIPACTPVRLQTLDANSVVLKAMRSWIWVMPNEARGCIGCHEDRELTPPNRHVLALRKPPVGVGVTERSRTVRRHTNRSTGSDYSAGDERRDK